MLCLRVSCCRYVVRVVPADKNVRDTHVTWESSDGIVIDNRDVVRGDFVEIDNTISTMSLLKVDCNASCVVMLYNKGRV